MVKAILQCTYTVTLMGPGNSNLFIFVTFLTVTKVRKLDSQEHSQLHPEKGQDSTDSTLHPEKGQDSTDSTLHPEKGQDSTDSTLHPEKGQDSTVPNGYQVMSSIPANCFTIVKGKVNRLYMMSNLQKSVFRCYIAVQSTITMIYVIIPSPLAPTSQFHQ